MAKNCLRGFLIICLLMAYINRGLFVAMPETEVLRTSKVENKHEVNSLLEFIIGLVDGKVNYTDEDGDSPESYGLIKFVQPFIFQVFFQSLELHKFLFSTTKEIYTPKSETIPVLFVYGQIDHPPQT